MVGDRDKVWNWANQDIPQFERLASVENKRDDLIEFESSIQCTLSTAEDLAHLLNLCEHTILQMLSLNRMVEKAGLENVSAVDAPICEITVCPTGSGASDCLPWPVAYSPIS
jgi:hypothetical protein